MRTLSLMIGLFIAASAYGQQASTTIMFGSCLDESRAHPVLSLAVERNPDYFIFLGDNVYADSSDPRTIERSYAALGASPLFQALNQSTQVRAVWDDHDYGRNDAGRDFPVREASERIFEAFWHVPRAALEREGIYRVEESGPEGQRVQIILLDTRSFRSPLVRTSPWPAGKGPYVAQDGAGTLLGAAQWEWLSEVLSRPADLRIVASSIQVLAEHHGWESWANFPHEQERLLSLLAANQAPSLIISGDRHFSEISERSVSGGGSTVTLTDITSSGINRGYPDPVPTRNANRVDGYYLDHNLGEIEITWSAEGIAPRVRARIYDREGGVRIEREFSF
jgi:alkaline phosphatase D